jgi:phosphomannomutase
MKASELRKTYPDYHIAKKRLELSDPALIDRILEKVKAAYAEEDLDLTDGVKVSFEEKRSWVHLRRSNTEPIIRIYSEAPSKEEAEELGEGIIRLARNEIGE